MREMQERFFHVFQNFSGDGDKHTNVSNHGITKDSAHLKIFGLLAYLPRELHSVRASPFCPPRTLW